MDKERKMEIKKESEEGQAGVERNETRKELI